MLLIVPDLPEYALPDLIHAEDPSAPLCYFHASFNHLIRQILQIFDVLVGREEPRQQHPRVLHYSITLQVS